MRGLQADPNSSRHHSREIERNKCSALTPFPNNCITEIKRISQMRLTKLLSRKKALV
jgi:hypothetical protein